MALEPGNLLTENQQSFLSSVTGWTGTGSVFVYNGTASIVSSNLDPQGVAAIQSSGTSDAVITLTNAVPVTPGTEYVAYGWFAITETRSLTATATIHWLDGSGVEIDTVSGSLSQSFTALRPYRPCAVGVAPAGASQAKMSVRLTSTSSEGQVSYWDHMFLGVPYEGNLLSYADYSSEFEPAPWTCTTGTVTWEDTRISLVDGMRAIGFVPDGTGTHTLRLDRWVPVTGGETYNAVVTVVADGTDPSSVIEARTGLEWRDAEGTLLPIEWPEPFFRLETPGTTNYSAAPSRTYEAPEGAVEARLVLQLLHDIHNTTAFYWIDRASIDLDVPTYTLSVDNELGMIALNLLSEPSEAAKTVSVHRIGEDGNPVPVRGYGVEMNRAPYSPASTIYLEDYEAPVDQRVFYRARWYDENGVMSDEVTTKTVTAPTIEDGSYVWVKAPGTPAMNTKVMMAENPTWEMAGRAAHYQVIGRSAPVVISEVRSSRSGKMKIRIEDWEVNDAARRLLASGLPILVQAQPGHGIDGNLYLAVGNVTYAPEQWNATLPGWLWELDVTEIDRPVGGLQGSAGRTWQDVLDEFETWDEVFATYGTWLGVQTGG